MKKWKLHWLAGTILWSLTMSGCSISETSDGEETSSFLQETDMGSEEEQEEQEEQKQQEQQEQQEREQQAFYSTEISDELFARMYGNSFKAECTVPKEDLRYLHVLHKDGNGVTHEGEMVVNKAIASRVVEIFRELYEADYPIEKICLVDVYGADDERSMEDNNSSAFNFRMISHSNKISKHGLGLAVDINPLYNPYVKDVEGKQVIEPVTAGEYVDREKDFPYKIDEKDLAYRLFTEAGFVWGGSWKKRKDYQHFELRDEEIAVIYPEQ